MLQERFSAGVRAGLIATAATSGVLVAYGLRARSIVAPFHFLGRHFAGFRDGIYPHSTVVLAGFLLHAAWIMAWCVAYALLAGLVQAKARMALAILTATFAYAFSARFIGSALESSGLGGPRWLFLHVVFAVALYQGTRLANHGEWRGARERGL